MTQRAKNVGYVDTFTDVRKCIRRYKYTDITADG